MKRWHEIKGFWVDFETRLFSPERIEKAKEEVGFIIHITKLKQGAKVLDMPCGVGRHSIIFSQLGYDVTGIDVTERYLKNAKKRCKKEKTKIHFKKGDMRRFREKEKFDLAINLFTSFGYFKKISDDRKVLRNIYSSLKPGGQFVIDIMGKEVLARIFRESTAYEENNGGLMVELREIRNSWDWIENKWIIVEHGKQKCYNVGHRLFSAVELKWMLEEAGFKIKNFYGDFNIHTPYSTAAKRLIIHAVKK